MKVTTNNVTITIGITNSEQLYYNGHQISWSRWCDSGDGPLVALHCNACAHSANMDGSMSTAESWIAIQYLLHEFDGTCTAKGSDIARTIENDIIPKYIGDPNTPQTRQQILDDIRVQVGPGVPIRVE